MNINEKNKKATILIASLLITLFLGVIVTFTLYNITHENIHAKVQETTENIEKNFTLVLHELKQDTIFKSKNLLSDKKVAKAFYEKDRKQLYALTKNIYNRMSKQNPYLKIATFRLTDGSTFLRLHKPAMYGDKLNKKRKIILDTIATKQQQFGFEVGKLKMTYRVVTPIFYNNTFAGVIEIGVEPEYITNRINKVFGIKTALLIKDEFKSINITQKNMLKMGDLLLARGGVLFSEKFNEFDLSIDDLHVIHNGVEYHIDSKIKLYNHKNELAGKFLVAYSVQEDKNLQQSLIKNNILFVLITLVILFLILNFGLNKFIDQIQRVQKKLKRQNKDLENAQSIAKLGSWSLDLNNNKLTWSDEIYKIFEIDKEKTEPSYELFINTIHPDDRESVNNAYENSLKTKKRYSIEHRLLMNDGSVKWVLEQCDTNFDKFDKPLLSIGTVQDITEQKKLTKKLESLVLTYDKYVMYSKTDLNGIITDVSQAFCDASGYTREELIGQNHNIVRHPDVSKETFQGLWERLKNKESFSSEVKNLKKDGGYFWVRTNFSPEYDENNNHIGYSAVRENITDRKEIEKLSLSLEDKIQDRTVELKELTKNLNNYLDTIQSILLALDKDGNITLINPEGAKQLGYAQDELIGKNWFDMCLPQPEGKEMVFPYFKQIMSGEESQQKYFENHIITKNGKQLYVAWHNALLKDNAENIIGVLSSGMDITDQKDLENQLATSKLFLENIMESALDGIITIDEKGKVQTFNKAAETLFGYTRDEIIGKNVKKLVPEPHHSNHDQYIKNYLDTGIKKAIGKTAELYGKHKDGSLFSISLRIGEVKINDTKIFTALIQDITERKKYEKELILAKEEAEEATNVKSRFLANMSHEIRTPMSAIIGMSHLILKTELNAKQENYINKISLSANNLLGIINDILDISKIEAGKMHIHKSNFNLFKVIENVMHLIGLKAKDKNLEITLMYDPSLGKEYFGDSLRINQILTNLLGNAVKFTDSGEIGLVVTKVNKNKVKFYVKDTGIGMTEDQICNLFQAFSQADSSTTKQYGGTGLGLLISKQLVEMMNGKMWVESKLGKGSVFSFELELEKKKEDTNYTIFNGKKVLIVDDCQSWLDILKELMESFGLDVDTVNSGIEAIELIKNNNNVIYDLLLVDWDMPELDGIETCKILENELNVDSHKIILVSAYDSNSLIEGIKEAHLDYYLHKPVNPSTLNDILNEIFFGKINTKKRIDLHNEQKLEQKIKTLKGSEILLAEDNSINQEIILDLLEESGIKIDIANNGYEAILKFKENSEKYELILMDIQMPILDGIEATKEIRQNDKNIPIIALTANAMKEDVEKTNAAGMNEHLNKPIEVEKLFKVLLEFIDPKVQISEIQNQTKEINDSFPKFETLDTQFGLKLLLNNEKAYTKVLQGLVKYRDINYEELNDEELKRIAHSLKGLSASAGAKELSVMAKEFEETLNKKNLPNMLAKLDVIVDEIDKKLPCTISEKKELTETTKVNLFKKLKESIKTRRPNHYKPIIEELESYNLNSKDRKLFEEIKILTSKFKFKEALELFNP